MSFYSYKNANAEASPGVISGNAWDGICERICVQVKNVYDSCISQEQLTNKTITVTNIVPIVSPGCANGLPTNANVPTTKQTTLNACSAAHRGVHGEIRRCTQYISTGR